MALVLPGGGARAAYQAGVLKGLIEICQTLIKGNPFPIITGISAGAINGCHCAGHVHDWDSGIKQLIQFWSEIGSHKVFDTHFISMSRITLSLLADIITGSFGNKKMAHALLGTSPLRKYLSERLQSKNIQMNLDKGHLESLAITATEYSGSTNISFVQSHPSVSMWQRKRRRGEQTKISVEHVMASCAIPMFFPSVKIDGRFFGDGSLRNSAPISPAIFLGAEKLLMISVYKFPDRIWEIPTKTDNPSLAWMLSVIISSIFFDAMDGDLERILRTNEELAAGRSRTLAGQPLKHVEVLTIRPSENLSDIAGELSDSMPPVMKHLLGTLGSLSEARDLISYLLFEPTYCQRLIDLGYRDCLAKREEVMRLWPPKAPNFLFIGDYCIHCGLQLIF